MSKDVMDAKQQRILESIISHLEEPMSKDKTANGTGDLTDSDNKGAIVRDPEVVAINGVCKLLNGLEERQRRRVLAFVVDKYATSADKEESLGSH